MTSKLALLAKRTIDAAWLHGSAYDLSSQAAFALESAQLLMSPEVAAELVALRERVAALEMQTRAAGACDVCGDVPELWCPDCAACRSGCLGGRDDTLCDHADAPWVGAS
ncbi:hypothetical protein [Streptomyces uncialis]|uniref:hypothetical protein n=1 Tax=Streptomyces uncialis TaxID=1048205 RepID=UPI0037B95C6C